MGVVWHLFHTPAGIVFVCDQRVILLSPQGNARVWELPNARRLFAGATPEGILVRQVLDSGQSLWLLRDGELRRYQPGEGSALSRSYIEIGTDNPADWVYLTRTGEIVRRSGPGLPEAILSSADVQATQAMLSGGWMRGNCFYVATITDGLHLTDTAGARVRAGKAEGLLSDQCNCLTGSRAGGVWVGSDRGISFVEDFSVARTTRFDGQVQAIEGGPDELLVGTVKSTVRLRHGVREDLPFPTFSFARQGTRVLAGSWRGIRVSENGGEFQELLSLPGNEVTDLVVSKTAPGVAYAVTNHGAVAIDLIAKKVTAALEIPEIPSQIAEDSAGRLWISTFAGEVRVYPPDLSRLLKSIPANRPTRLANLNGAPVLLREAVGFQTTGGMSIPGTENLVTPIGGSEPQPAIWVAALSGKTPLVGRLEEGEGAPVWKKLNTPGLDQLRPLTAMHAAGSRLYLGGYGKLIEVERTAVTEPVLAAPTIEGVFARNGQTRKLRRLPGDDLRLRADENEIEVRLRRRIWGLQTPPVFEAKLQPVETEWSLQAQGANLVRGGLAPGSYVLQVRSRQLDVIGSVTSIGFSRAAPWYASQLSITGFAFLVTAAFFGAVRLRTLKINREKRALEEKVNERTRELARANAAKSDFLAAMSHEIRNPMNGVIGISRILQESGTSDREQYLLKNLNRCADQLRTTVDDILDFSRIEAGEVSLYVSNFHLREAIEATLLAADVTGTKVELTSWAGGTPWVRGDQAKFAQVLTNYVSNALKYGVPPHASVDVSVLDEHEQRCQVTVSVRNSGPDIPEEQIPKLFERFQRGDAKRVQGIRGTGLGLAICKSYARALGGGVDVLSTGSVTIFQVTVPFEKISAPTKADAPASKLAPLNARALAIEDEDYNRLVLGSILAKLGYKVDWAIDGRTAIALAEKNAYDLVLTDWMLPDTDGATLAALLLKAFRAPQPPIFAVTAYSTKEKQEECLRAGMSGFVSKPVTLEKLENALRAWAHQRPIAARVEIAPVDISVAKLAQLGPIEKVRVEYCAVLQQSWQKVRADSRERPGSAADEAHKLISQVLVIDANTLAGQLRALETALRSQPSGREADSLLSSCNQEIDTIVTRLLAWPASPAITEDRPPK